MNGSPIPEAASAEVPRTAVIALRTSSTSKAGDTDYLLASRVRQGSLVAVGALVEKYRQPIIEFASRLLGDPTEAQDVAQNVFLQVLKRADGFQSRSKFSTWLYAIARNLCRNEHRRRLRQRIEPFDNASRDDQGSRLWTRELIGQGDIEGAWFERVELEQKIEELLATLPQKQRTAILMLMEQDLSYEKIAFTLGTSVSATKSLIHRGRKELKRKLQPFLSSGNRDGRLWSSRAQESKPQPGYVRKHLWD